MKEVETVSDLLMNMQLGLRGKTQARIDGFYTEFDDEWPGAEVAAHRFRHCMDSIERLLGSSIAKSAWRSEVNFFTLFAVVYDLEWGLGSPFKSRKAKRRLPSSIGQDLADLGARLAASDVPEEVLDAMQRASADTGRRQTRFEFIRNALSID